MDASKILWSLKSIMKETCYSNIFNTCLHLLLLYTYLMQLSFFDRSLYGCIKASYSAILDLIWQLILPQSSCMQLYWTGHTIANSLFVIFCTNHLDRAHSMLLFAFYKHKTDGNWWLQPNTTLTQPYLPPPETDWHLPRPNWST